MSNRRTRFARRDSLIRPIATRHSLRMQLFFLFRGPCGPKDPSKRNTVHGTTPLRSGLESLFRPFEVRLHFNFQPLGRYFRWSERFWSRIAHAICYQRPSINQSGIHRCFAVLGVILRASLRRWRALEESVAGDEMRCSVFGGRFRRTGGIIDGQGTRVCGRKY